MMSLVSCQTNNKQEENSNNKSKYKYTEKEFEELVLEISEIDTLVNVSAREYADRYFSLGEAYYERNALEKSLDTLRKGLELESTKYMYQLLAAEIEFELKEYEKSYARLLTIKNSLDTEMMDEAMKLEKKIIDAGYVYNGIFVPNNFDQYIYILPIDVVDDLYIQSMKKKLESEYKIAIKIMTDVLIPTNENIRDNHKRYFDLVVEDYISKNGEDRFNKLLTYLKDNGFISQTDYINERVVYFFYLQEDHGEELWRTNMKLIEDQYDADKITKQILSLYHQEINQVNCLGILGVTSKDIYANTYNFLFGWSGSAVAVMSYNRFIKDDSSTEIKIKRTNMQALSSVGYLVGIPRCTVAHCSRAYPHSLYEHDKKKEILCDECKKNLKDVYEKN